MSRYIYAIAVACAAVAVLPPEVAVANAPAARAAVSNDARIRKAPEAGQYLVVARGKQTARTRSRGR